MGSFEAEANLQKHGVSFEDGMTLFADPNELMLDDPDHSGAENRLISIGRSSTGELMLACCIEMGSTLRLISVRKATRLEGVAYTRQGERDA